MMDTQIAQLANTQQQKAPGTLPPVGESPHETANVITTREELFANDVRSAGTLERELDRADLSSIELGGTQSSHGELGRIGEPAAEDQTLTRSSYAELDRVSLNSAKSHSTRSSGASDKGNSPPKKDEVPIKIEPPYPAALRRKTPLQLKFNKFLGVMKQLKVNLPFLDLLSQIPAYTKYMKDILNRKRTTEEVKVVTFSETSSECLSKIPSKLTDPGKFSIPCAIGTLQIDNAFCDLGASVSIIPYSVYKRLPKTPLRPTDVTIQ
ncbi:hypothetical protein RND81_07G045600 [Saponaria officinalis]|uniref:Uncharacterized protein n=1 Tax=Saponaria officinalis TaxID=3572 RepID=A0AAW1JNS7_SAPOF